MARFKVRPFKDPRCHLQMSPFSMSWMCWTMRLMATGERWMTCKAFMLEKLAEKPSWQNNKTKKQTLTHVVNSPWNDDICILLCLRQKQMSLEIRTVLDRFRHWKIGTPSVITIILTGKQNSSKAGLTNVVYWVRICSRSLPLFMSRRTTEKIRFNYWYTVCNIWNFVQEGDTDTSAWQSDVWICVHKELHVKHIPHFLGVEDQDPLKEDNICWVNCDPVF